MKKELTVFVCKYAPTCSSEKDCLKCEFLKYLEIKHLAEEEESPSFPS